MSAARTGADAEQLRLEVEGEEVPRRGIGLSGDVEEQVVADQVEGDQTIFQFQMCFRCTDCNKMLDSTNMAEKEEVVYPMVPAVNDLHDMIRRPKPGDEKVKEQ